jgi:hypothetical protein
MMTISSEGRFMQPTDNSFDGITGTWELVTEGLFPVGSSGIFETNIRTGLASTVALRQEDVDRMNGSCITVKY